MSDLLERLKTEVLFAMGSHITNLVDRGFNMTESGQWWISNHPDQYQDLLESFLNAGTDIVEAVLTHKYRLKAHGLQDKATEINSKIIKINRETIPGNRYLAC